jgi:hypothetical protein
MTELDRIREFIKSNLTVFDEGVSFGDDDNIFELDILDSELNIDNFTSVNCIGEFVRAKKGQ